MSRSEQFATQADLQSRLDDSRPGGGHLHVRPWPVSCRHETLTRAVEVAVVPRLVLAHAAAAPLSSGARGWAQEDVAELARLALRRGDDAAPYIAALQARGAEAAALCLDLLAPAARHLGDLWTEDLCSFADVTRGVLRLHQALHALVPALRAEARRRAASAPRILLAPAPGDQHSFGLAMVAHFFRGAGWAVHDRAASSAELAALVSAQTFDLVGFSASCDRHLGPLAACIRAVRTASRNLALGVLVGGPVFARHPEAAARVGADAAAVDAGQALAQAQALLAALGRPERTRPR